MKTPYIAHLLSSVSFDTAIGVHMAHQLSKIAEQLTCRQLCLLKHAVVKLWQVLSIIIISSNFQIIVNSFFENLFTPFNAVKTVHDPREKSGMGDFDLLRSWLKTSHNVYYVKLYNLY